MTTKGNNIKFEQEYAFRSVELFKSETLGTGAYGVVCKAKCDQLLCAAKLLYPVLFQVQVADPGKEHRQPFQRFELECRFLSLINHPNIVQYLGTYHDRETNSPVLLMELMDDSLTHFLKTAPEDVPYHIQVNLSFDIAQALAFLHANGIIHRDLSSNNVLLLAGRAKVADFGMSKFATQFASMTTCPGTPFFMPPEALSEPPKYTEKLDNFSLGVIMVQIITRKYPEPTDGFVTRELIDPNFPSQKITAKVAVPEIQRREAHISLIDKEHPLRPTAIECLSDKDTNRPTIRELCNRLALLKELSKYTDSLKQDKDHLLKEKNQQLAEKEQLIQVQQRELQETKTQIEQLQERHKDIPNQDNTTQLKEHTERDLQLFRTQILEKENQLRAKNSEIESLREQLAESNRSLATSQQLRRDAERKEQDSVRAQQAAARHSEATIHTLERDLSRKDAKVKELQTQLALSTYTILSDKTPAGGIGRQISAPEPESPQVRRVRDQSSVDRATPKSTTPTSTPNGTPGSARKQYAWKRIPSAPSKFKAGSVAVHESIAYFRGAGSNTVYKFDASTRKWETAGHHHLYGFALVIIERTLTSVGGYEKGESSGKLFDLVENSWVENLPEMPIKRDRPTAVYTDGHLIVLGGCDDHESPLHTVSILEVSTGQWGKATSLPFPIFQASAVACNDKLYLTTGDVKDSNAYSILTCSVSVLIHSLKPLTLGARLKKVSQKKLWQVLNVLPVRQSCLAIANDDELIAVGGMDSSEQNSKNVFKYDSSTNSWKVVTEMGTGRSSCLVAVFSGHLLMVVGLPNKEVEAIILPQSS